MFFLARLLHTQHAHQHGSEHGTRRHHSVSQLQRRSASMCAAAYTIPPALGRVLQANCCPPDQCMRDPGLIQPWRLPDD